jgi:hypothetical protein
MCSASAMRSVLTTLGRVKFAWWWRGLLAAGDQREAGAVGVLEERPPTERLLNQRLRELNAALRELAYVPGRSSQMNMTFDVDSTGLVEKACEPAW